jgi:lysophospholipase L1-like esterase
MASVISIGTVAVDSSGVITFPVTLGVAPYVFNAPTSAALCGLIVKETRNGATYAYPVISGSFSGSNFTGQLGAIPGTGVTLTIDATAGSTIISDSASNALLGQNGVAVTNNSTSTRTALSLTGVNALPANLELSTSSVGTFRFKLVITGNADVNTYVNNFNGTQPIRVTSADGVAMANPSGGWMHTGNSAFQAKTMLSLTAGTYTITMQGYQGFAFTNSTTGALIDVINGGTVTLSAATELAGATVYAQTDVTKVRTTSSWTNASTIKCTGIPWMLCSYNNSASETIDVYRDQVPVAQYTNTQRLALFLPAPSVNLQKLAYKIPPASYVDDGLAHEWTVYASGATISTVWSSGGVFSAPPAAPTLNFILFSDSRGAGLAQATGIILNKNPLNNSLGGASVASSVSAQRFASSLGQSNVSDIIIQLGVNDTSTSTLPDLPTLYSQIRNGIGATAGYPSASGVRLWHLEEYTFLTNSNCNNAIRADIAALGETNSKMITNSQTWGNWAAGQLTIDGIHPTAAGYAVLAKRIGNIIRCYDASPAYTISGPASGGSPSTDFTVTMSGTLLFDATQLDKVTLMASAGTIGVTAPGGTITNNNTSAVTTQPADLTSSFTFKLTTAANSAITPTNNVNWTNPAAVNYTLSGGGGSGKGMFKGVIGSGVFGLMVALGALALYSHLLR